jgi:hypothetical protein
LGNNPLILKKVRSIDPFLVVIIKRNSPGGNKLAKPNYQFKKRQKELAKKEKKELKRQRKIDQKTDESETQQDQTQKTIEPPETT